MKKMIYFLLFAISYIAYPQKLDLFDINTASFPTIVANFYAVDPSINQIQGLKPSDIEIIENGLKRNVSYLSCPAPIQAEAVSSILTIDLGASLKPKQFEIAKAAAKEWISLVPLNIGECAITSFSEFNYLNSDFSQDRQILLKKIDSLKRKDWTDYNSGFVFSPAGGLVISQRAKYKKIIIFISSGYPTNEVMTDSIIAEANRQGCKIFSIIPINECPVSLQKICEQTGGKVFHKIYSAEEAAQIIHQILYIAQGGKPCRIEWQSGLTCKSNVINGNFKIIPNNLSAELYYKSSDKSVPDLKFSALSVYFYNLPIGKTKDTNITITAVNSDFKVTKITSSNPAFKLDKTSFDLAKGYSTQLKVSFTPIDSSYAYTELNFENSTCPVYYYVSAGWKDKPLLIKTLNITHPNGGEVFVAGSDTLITWEGIPKPDTVRIDLSIDSGKSWRTLTNKATNWEYKWENVPKPESNKCLLRIRQFDAQNGYKEIPPKIKWSKTFGGTNLEYVGSIEPTRDKGYIFTGYTQSPDGDFPSKYLFYDVVVVKINETGDIEWYKVFGGNNYEIGYYAKQTPDGGYILTGVTSSTDGDMSENTHSSDIFIFKLNAKGNLVWKKFYGGKEYDILSSLIITKEGDYVFSGYRLSIDWVPTQDSISSEIIIMKLNSLGDSLWLKSYGGAKSDNATSIQQTKDGGFIVGGYSVSNDRDIPANYGYSDGIIMKLDENGEIEWTHNYGGSSSDFIYSVIQTEDNGYAFVGYTSSQDGDIKTNKGPTDFWVGKIDENGVSQWHKTYGGSKYDMSEFIVQTAAGDYIINGFSASNDGDIPGNMGYGDVVLMKLDQQGELVWCQNYGGSSEDAVYAFSFEENKIIVGVTTLSNDGDFPSNHGKNDIGIIKFDQFAEIIQEDITDSVFAIVEPHCQSDDIDMKQCLLGTSKDSIINPFTTNIGLYKLTVDSVYFTGDDASAFKIISTEPESELAPNEVQQAEILFTPSRLGLHNAQIVVVTQSETLAKTIIGEGVQPQIEILTKIIDFDSVKIGKKKDSLIVAVLKNIGNREVSFSGIEFWGPNTTDFRLASGAVDTSFKLQPEELTDIYLSFSPTEKGQTSGQLIFNHNDYGSPSIIQLLGTGIKNTPQIIAQLTEDPRSICFEPVPLTVTISNSGEFPLLIDGIEIIGTNKDDFEYTGEENFSLAADSSIQLIIMFKPSEAGTRTAQIEIKSNSEPDSLITLNISGFTETISLVPERKIIDYGYLCASATIEDTIIIKNTGTIKTGAYLQTSQKIFPAINEFTIDVNDSIKVPFSLKYLDNYTSAFTQTIYIIDSLCGNVDSIIVSGIVSNQEIDAPDIDLGFLCPDEIKDTILIIKNSGKLIFNANVNSTSNITYQDSTFSLDAEAVHNLNLKFKGGTAGIISEKITLTDSACKYSKVVNIKGSIVLPEIICDDIAISSVLNQSNTGTITLINPSERDIDITNAPLIQPPFSFAPNQFPATIKAQDSLMLIIQYLPTDTLPHSITILINAEPCGITKGISISGKLITSKASIIIGSAQAYAGETVEIPVILKDALNLQLSGITGLDAELSFNSTVLAPLDYTPYFIDITTSGIILKNLPIKENEIAKIRFVAALGNSDSTEIKMFNLKLNGNSSEIKIQTGIFKLLGICSEGGKRLFYGSGKTGLLSITPNPADEEIIVSFNLIENDVSYIYIYNSLGMEVYKYKISQIKTGINELKLNISGMSNGLYFVKLQTATYFDMMKLIIGK